MKSTIELRVFHMQKNKDCPVLLFLMIEIVSCMNNNNNKLDKTLVAFDCLIGPLNSSVM